MNETDLYFIHEHDAFAFEIRDEIARCIEKAYEKISFHEARRMLFFNQDAVESYKEYVKQVSWLDDKNTYDDMTHTAANGVS